MPELLQRRELKYLAEWRARDSRKPLIIRGARQVGKSTLVHQFAESSQLDLLEINFERNPEFRAAFSTNDPVDIQTTLHLLTGKKLMPGKTLLFLDEIQAAPEALVSLRYWYEEFPQLHVLAAGSLLEFTLEDAQFSMPVGRVEYLHLGPIQFEDFLTAMGHPELALYLQNLSLESIIHNSILPPVHQKLMRLLHQYWVVGGLPEAIASFVQTADFNEVTRVQQSIVSTYRDDFNKYSQGRLKERVQLIFDQLPVMVGRKFKYAQVSREHRAAELDSALNQLCMARVAIRVHHSSANGIPLGAEMDKRKFKTLYLDIGLMCAALNLNLLDLAKDDFKLVNNGALAEQFIGQHLMYAGAYFETPALYYWMREAKSAAAEVDYLIVSGQQVIPVEIKAGKSGSLKSLHQFLKEKNRSLGLRLNADTPSLLNEKSNLTDGTTINYQLLSLPLYLIGQAHRLVRENLTETKPKISN